jgi:mannose-6-phosphate isomerase-like protein (cupin superfamily)
MKTFRAVASLAIALSAVGLWRPVVAQTVTSQAKPMGDSASAILRRYADAWLGRKELALPRPIVLALAVSGEQGGNFTLELSNEPGGTLHEGMPAQYDIRFDVAVEFLRRLDRDEMGALTAMGQARSSDPIPLSPRFGPDFGKIADAPLLFRRLCFHFWNRGWPEITPFSESAAREVHGGNAAVFVYDRGFRSAWYQLKPGMHINADPKDQTNNFPQLIIVTRGKFRARLDGRELILSEGQAVFIPAGMAHEFWAGPGQYGELIWTAFGEGA